MLLKFSQKPSHFFGNFGILSVFIGFLIVAILYLVKFAYGVLINQHSYLFFIAIMMIIVGVQLFSIGILGEIIVSRSVDKKEFFRIKKILKWNLQKPPLFYR